MHKIRQRSGTDCERAAVASIFEIPYEMTKELDGTNQKIFDWTKKYYPALRARVVFLDDLENEWRLGKEAYKLWPQEHFEVGYWLAGILSSNFASHETEYGVHWGMHAVVMHNDRLVWDPLGREERKNLYIRSVTTWHVEDPGLLKYSLFDGLQSD